MDRAPAKLPNTSSRLIAMAVSLAGDPKVVRKVMGCTSGDFRKYSDGRKEPPFGEFDRLVSYIVKEQRKLIEKNIGLLAKIRARQAKT